jgi:hypothetical protein
VRCQSIHKFLKDHQASNVVSEDESFYSSEDDDDDDDEVTPQLLKRDFGIVWSQRLLRGSQKEVRDILPPLLSIIST